MTPSNKVEELTDHSLNIAGQARDRHQMREQTQVGKHEVVPEHQSNADWERRKAMIKW